MNQMSAGIPGKEPPSPEDRRLIDAYLNSDVSPEDFGTLERRLLESAALRAYFRQALAVDALLYEWQEGGPVQPVQERRGMVEVSSQRDQLVERRGRRWQLPFHLAAAVGLVWVACFEIAWLGFIAPGVPGGQAPQRGAKPAIAQLVSQSKDARFAKSRPQTSAAGLSFGKEWVGLTHGSVTLRFESGATVFLQAPAQLGIDSPLRCFLEYGRVSVTAPESARDFVVATEAVEVVDLGTRFEVSVDRASGMADVSVSEGLVDLKLGSPGVARVVQPVTEGQSARIDATGTIVEVRSLPAVGSERMMPPRLLAHLALDEIRENGTLVDASGQGHHGTAQPAGVSQAVAGHVSQAASLANGRWIDVSDLVTSFRALDAFTVSCWIRNPRTGVAVVFSASDGTAHQRLQLQVHQGSLAYGWQAGSEFDAISGAVKGWGRDQWHHIAMTFDRGLVSLYLDGGLVGSGRYGRKLGLAAVGPAGLAGISQVQVGRLPDASPGRDIWPQWFDGDIDDLQIYGTALSAAAIGQLFHMPGQTLPELHPWHGGSARHPYFGRNASDGLPGRVLERPAFPSKKNYKTGFGMMPTRYGGPTSELRATVEAGRNVFDFQLTSSE